MYNLVSCLLLHMPHAHALPMHAAVIPRHAAGAAVRCLPEAVAALSAVSMLMLC